MITRALLVLLLVGTLSGCRGREEPSGRTVVIDLVESLPFAEVEPEAARSTVERGAQEGISLPGGVEVRYHFRLPREARLEVEANTSSAESPFRWTLQREAEPPVELLVTPDKGGARSAALPGEPGSLVRLTVALAAETGRATVTAASVSGWGESERAAVAQSVEEAAPASPAGSTPNARPNIVLYLIDTLRADHLGVYGYERNTSPEIDRFASEATLYEDVLAQSSWTKSGVASLMTGLWPVAHGANRRDEQLAPEADTLAEYLKGAGYETSAFVANPVAGPAYGFDQGFERFQMLDKTSSETLGDEALGWIDRTEGPFFTYIHTIEPHMPYRPRSPHREEWAPQVPHPTQLGTRLAVSAIERGELEVTPSVISDTIDLYDGEIATNDQDFGVFLEALRSRDLLEETIVILVSDHGEEFHEHGEWSHGKSLHEETVRVPMIIRWPGDLEARRVSDTVAQVDLLPTLLSVLGLSSKTPLDGQFLSARSGAEALYSYLALSGPKHLAIVDGGYKMTMRRVGGGVIYQLYDRVNDPGELENLAESRPVHTGYLAERLRRWTAENAPAWTAEAVELTPELTDELKALGYL